MERGDAMGLRLARREDGALDDVFTTYGPSLRAYLTRFVGPNDAEDVLQKTLLDVWRQAKRYDANQRFSSWLFTIAHHRAIDTLRARRHDIVDVDLARTLIGEDGRETAERYADAAEVHEGLTRLPEHERTVLALAYFEGLTLREVAARLDIPEGTAKSRAARGTRRLGGLLRAAGTYGGVS